MKVKAFLAAAAAALALAQSGCQTSGIQSVPTTEGDDIVYLHAPKKSPWALG